MHFGMKLPGVGSHNIILSFNLLILFFLWWIGAMGHVIKLERLSSNVGLRSAFLKYRGQAFFFFFSF